MNKIVVLKGKQNTGKTTTIRLAYRMLLELLENTPVSYLVKYNSYQYDRDCDDDFMDFTAIVDISDHIVVFHSPGDTKWFVDLLKEHLERPNMIIICATRDHGNHQTVIKLNELAVEYNYQLDQVKKVEPSDMDNNDKACYLLNKIGKTLKEKLESPENLKNISNKQNNLLYKLADSLCSEKAG